MGVQVRTIFEILELEFSLFDLMRNEWHDVLIISLENITVDLEYIICTYMPSRYSTLHCPLIPFFSFTSTSLA